MLYIISVIVKTAGMILAALVALLLIILFLLLFIPVRYRIRADGKLGEKEPFHARIKLTWFFHMINVSFVYPQAAYLRARIFVFTVFNSSAPVKETKKRRRKPPDSQTDTSTAPEEPTREPAQEREAVQTGEPDAKGRGERPAQSPVPEERSPGPEEHGSDRPVSEPAADGGREETKPGFKDRIEAVFIKLRRIFIKIKTGIGNIRYTIERICDKIRKIASDIQYYTDVMQSDVFKAAFALSKKQLGRIFKSVRPKKCDIWMRVGAGDPAGTGQILSLYGIFYPLIGNNVKIEADFGEKAAVEGRLSVSGRITFFTLLSVGIKVYRDKNIRRLIRMFKREEA